MRLLAVTGGDEAQGKLTEADQIIGSITVHGTVGLYVFGGILPGLLSTDGFTRLARSRSVDIAGRVVLGVLALISAPGAVAALVDISTRG